MGNLVSFDKQKLIEGLDILFAAVAPSLGPRAYTAALDESFRRRVIDDGVEIAKRVILEDKVANFGANLVAEAARKTADEAGDGTTATIILAHAIIHESLKLIATGVHPMSLRVGLEEGIKLLIKEVDTIKTPITKSEQAIQIATISCKDPVLGKLVAQTIDEMGVDGIVTVEESSASETYVDYQKGMRFESGYAHPAFVTHPEQMEAIYATPKLLVIDKAISFESLLPIFSEIQKKGESLVILAPSLDARMGEFLIENKRKGAIQALYINAPYAANFQKDFLQDIAILTGATYIPLTEGGRVEDIKYSDLGSCEKIISSHNSTIIINGLGDKSAIKNRIDQIKAQLKSTPSDFDNAKLKERLAKLTTGIAVIKIGGQTQVEMQERKERAIDAVAATKAAVEDGIVIGGEMAYFALTNALDVNVEAHRILSKAIQKPFEQLLTNSGLDVGQYREKLRTNQEATADKYIFSKDSGMTPEDVARIDMSDPEQYLLVEGKAKDAVTIISGQQIPNAGIDVTTGKVIDMLENGIIDPAKVVKSALQNSVSVAIQFLTINVIIAPMDEKKVMPK